MAPKSSSSSKNVQALASKLSGVASVAKSMGINTAKSDAMVAQTRSQGSKSYKGSSYDKGQQDVSPVINSAKIAPVSKITLPEKPVPNDMTAVTDGINSALATGSNGAYTYDAAKGFVNTPQVAQQDTAVSSFNQMMSALDSNFKNNSFNAQKEVAAGEKYLRPKEQLVQSLQNQINTITSTRDAQQIGLEGQGRGQTTAFLGGEQARIGREAAIQALPLQAQLSAAQGDLESARAHVDRLYAAKAQDAQANYQYQASKIQAVYGFLTAQEAKIADQKKMEQTRAWQVEDRNITMANNLANTAFETGQSTLAGRIMALDTKSPTFSADLARLQGQVVKPVSGGSSAWELKDVNGVSSWVNKNTLEVKPVGGAGIGAPDAAQKSLDQLSFLRNTAKDAIANAKDRGIFRTPVGPSLITQGIGNTFIGNTAFKQLQNQTDTLKTNVLSLMTDPNVKKFFGPQMSNADVRLMSSTGSTLNPAEQTPEEYIKEVQRLDSLFNRMQTAVQNGLAGQITRSSNIITAPDGTQIEIID